MVLETAVRLVFHTVLVFGVYLLFAGHNQPGGGFVGGLVAGLRLRAALRRRPGATGIGRAVPVDPALPLGAGLLLAGGDRRRGLAVRRRSSSRAATSSSTCPCSASSRRPARCAFDTGVFLVVVGLVLARAAHPRRGGGAVTGNLTLALLIGVLYAVGTYLLLQRTLTRVVIGLGPA